MPIHLARLLLLSSFVFGIAHAVDAAAFILKVDTNRTGATTNKTFRLALNLARSYDCTIAWGDGTSTVVTGTPVSDPVRVYGTAGVKTITITQRSAGGFPQVRFANGGDANKVVELAQWGQVDWQSFESAFFGCTAMTITATDTATARTGSVTDFARGWTYCSSLTSFPPITTSLGMNFEYAWYGCRRLTGFPLLDTANGTNFQFAWSGCRAMTSFLAINTAKGEQFDSTWVGCSELTNFPLLSLGSATELNNTWASCTKLTSFPLLNTSQIAKFSGTWSNCSSLASFPLLDVSKGTDFSSTWNGCAALTEFPLLNVSGGVTFYNAWSSCTGLRAFPLLNTSAGTDFSGAWYGCYNLTSFPLINTASAKNLFSAWRDCSGLTSFPKVNTANVTAFNGAWSGCLRLISFPPLNTTKGSDFIETWQTCYSLVDFPDLDLRNMTAGRDCFANTRLPTNTYSRLLINLAASNSNRDVVLGGGGSYFNKNAEDDRGLLVYTRGWTITDAGLEPPIITSPPVANMIINQPASFQITTTGETRYFLVRDLPAGLVYDRDSGLISGIPTGPIGNSIASVNAFNVYDNYDFSLLYISVSSAGAVPQITSPAQASGSPGSPFSYQITATNSPTAFDANRSNVTVLPPGLAVDSTTGLITGTMTETFFGDMVISATNGAGTTYGYFKLNMGTPPSGGGGGTGGSGGGGGGGGCGLGGGTAAGLLLGGLLLLHGPGFRRRRLGQK